MSNQKDIINYLKEHYIPQQEIRINNRLNKITDRVKSESSSGMETYNLAKSCFIDVFRKYGDFLSDEDDESIMLAMEMYICEWKIDPDEGISIVNGKIDMDEGDYDENASGLAEALTSIERMWSSYKINQDVLEAVYSCLIYNPENYETRDIVYISKEGNGDSKYIETIKSYLKYNECYEINGSNAIEILNNFKENLEGGFFVGLPDLNTVESIMILLSSLYDCKKDNFDKLLKEDEEYKELIKEIEELSKLKED